MTPSTILRPAVVMRARNKQVYVLDPITLTAGRTLDDWDEFVLTVREVPDWPRKWHQSADNADPYYDSWAEVVALTFAAGDVIVGDTLELPIAAAEIDLPGGVERYAHDVRGLGGTAGEVTLRDPMFLTILPRVG